MDPLNAIANIFVGWHRTGKMNDAFLRLHGWAKLLFGMFLSFFITFNTVAGAALMADKGWAFSIGAGMVSGAAMSAVAFFRANAKLTEGVVLAIPGNTLDAQFNEKGKGPMVSSPPPEKK